MVHFPRHCPGEAVGLQENCAFGTAPHPTLMEWECRLEEEGAWGQEPEALYSGSRVCKWTSALCSPWKLTEVLGGGGGELWRPQTTVSGSFKVSATPPPHSICTLEWAVMWQLRFNKGSKRVLSENRVSAFYSFIKYLLNNYQAWAMAWYSFYHIPCMKKNYREDTF